MTPQIATVFAILVIAIILFITERIRVDVVALLVLVSLAVTGLVTPAEALSGLSNPAVVTVGAVLVLSGGLSRTGVAGVIGRQLLRLGGSGEIRLLVMIMATAGILSGLMNSIGVAALFLPVVMDIARRTGIPPSRLLMPLAFSALLGGLTTLIGTPPNILISEALSAAGLAPFRLFDYAPVGIFVTASGIAFMALVGRHLLPARGLARARDAGATPDLEELYELGAHLFTIRVPEGSSLAGMTLAQSRIGAALGLNVIAVLRDTHTSLSPAPNTVLREGDRLLVEGQPDRLTEEQDHKHLVVEEDTPRISWLSSPSVEFAEARVATESSLIGQILPEIRFRQRFGAIVLAIRRGDDPRRTGLTEIPLQAGDRLLVEASPERVEAMRGSPEFDRCERMLEEEVAAAYRLQERLFALRVPEGSGLVGRSLAESRLGAAYGLGVLGILRGQDTLLMPDTEERLEPGDILVVKGRQEVLEAMRDLEDLEVDQQAALDLGGLESDRVGMVEAVLSPHTTL
ncbi:MAG: SLC13 family permease, partial [Anaerolineae bacterium]